MQPYRMSGEPTLWGYLLAEWAKAATLLANSYSGLVPGRGKCMSECVQWHQSRVI